MLQICTLILEQLQMVIKAQYHLITILSYISFPLFAFLLNLINRTDKLLILTDQVTILHSY